MAIDGVTIRRTCKNSNSLFHAGEHDVITIVVSMCHMLAAMSLCHEVIVAKQEMSMPVCMVQAQMIIADWKENSIYQGEQWTVEKVGCMPGDYQVRDSI